MKIGGIDPNLVKSEDVLVLPRGGERIVFKAAAIASYDEFYDRCPYPKPPTKLVKGQAVEDRNADFAMAEKNWYDKKVGFLVFKTLEPSRIEWDTLKTDDSQTWPRWHEDLASGGLLPREIDWIWQLVQRVNALDESMLQQARDAFLLGQAQAQGS